MIFPAFLRLFTMDDIRNHAYIKIDEKGINNENSSIPVRNDMVMDKREAFRANHPFLYAITDNHGTVLWIGRFTRKNRETIVENSDESLECKEMPKKKRQKL
ncbi:serpin [Wuchereria bancrofti]|uniref:Serpin n=1 Tax=Wuchereria bancrofti TaxID=6293 RepID=J9AJ67_WUCBA|nr:serpin [Wuchereria bancrofti]